MGNPGEIPHIGWKTLGVYRGNGRGSSLGGGSNEIYTILYMAIGISSILKSNGHYYFFSMCGN